MDYNSRDRLTLARRFLEPTNSAHRHYEALRAFFVEGIRSAQAAARFGYTPGSFRVLVHQFRNDPGRGFFSRHPGGRPPASSNGCASASSHSGNRTSPFTTSAVVSPARTSRLAPRRSPPF